MKQTICDICGDVMHANNPRKEHEVESLLNNPDDVCHACIRAMDKLNWEKVIKAAIMDMRSHADG